ncbi:MAG: geranylgeranylglycerol-phosphate geranylgeranyltransferase, partial [Bacteroidota bacterium]
NDFITLVRLGRPLNLLISAGVFAYAAWFSFDASTRFVQLPLFWEELAMMLLIAMAGYWINDVYDFQIDRINKPHKQLVSVTISRKKVVSAYLVVNAFVLGYTLATLPPKYIFINVLAMFLLYIYASVFKKLAIIGNLLIATLTSLVVFAGAWLHDPMQLKLLWLMLFAFELTLIREIVKDVEDMRGDMAYDLRTLPLIVGIRQSKVWIAVMMGLFALTCNLPWLFHRVLWGEWLVIYPLVSVFLVQLPVLGLVVLLRRAIRPRDFGRLSQLLKWLIPLGLLSLSVI